MLVLVVLVLVLALFVLSHIRSPKQSLTLPGPRPVPVLGNLHQLGPNWPETFRRWSAVYGPVFSIRIGERPVLVINAPRAAKALLVDQGGAYISRPWFHTFHNVLSAKGKSAFTIGSSPWDASCKDRRQVAATALDKPCVQSYTPIIEAEALALLGDLLARGQAGRAIIDPYKYFQRLALNTSLFVNYGTRIEDINDKLFQEITEVTHKVAGCFRSVCAVSSS
jgi:phenylacetate 2-hydroxylase